MKKKDYFYFVSYNWNSNRQSGNGSIEITLNKKISSYNEITEIKDYLDKNIKDTYGNKTQNVVLYYSKLDKGING